MPFKITILISLLVLPFTSTTAIDLVVESTELWNNISNVQLSGNLMYCSADFGLIVLNAADPDSISLAGHLDLLDGVGRRLRVSGNVVYLADDLNGLIAIDVSDPGNPIQLGRVAFSDANLDVRILDTLAYVSSWGDGFSIVNVSNPANLEVVGHLGGHTQGLQVRPGFIYSASHHEGLFIYDVTNPGAIAGLGSTDTPDHAYSVDLHDTVAYVADLSRFTTVSIANPLQPYVLGWYLNASFSIDVVADYPHALMAAGQKGMIVFDVSDPATPEPVAEYDTEGLTLGIDIDGNRCAIADWSAVEIIDISSRTSPVRIGWYATVGKTLALAGSSGALVAATERGGLQVLGQDESDQLTRLASLPLPSVDVLVAGNRVYVACSDNSIRIVDIANPALPVQVGSKTVADSCLEIAASGNLLLAALDNLTIAVMKISGQDSLQLIQTINGASKVTAMAIQGGRAAIAFAGGAIKLYSTSDTFGLSEKATVNTGKAVSDLLFRSDQLWTSYRIDGVAAYNVVTISSPVFLGSYDIVGHDENAITSRGKYLFVATYDFGVFGLDISNPSALSQAMSCMVSSGVSSVMFQSDRLLTVGAAGLVELKLTGIACGDADASGLVTVSDAVYLINYIFADGTAPITTVAGDPDCNSLITISDAVFLINYIFAGGSSPCQSCN